MLTKTSNETQDTQFIFWCNKTTGNATKSAILHYAGIVRPVGLPHIQYSLGVLGSFPGAWVCSSPYLRGGSSLP